MTRTAGTVNAGNIKGVLDLKLGCDPEGRTACRRAYRDGSFHLSKPYWDGRQLLVQLVNPTAGIFSNDSLCSTIVAGPGTRSCLVSPSSSQVYAMPDGGTATISQAIRLEGDASMAILPKWLVLHGNSRIRQATRIDLDENASILCFDFVAAGRRAFGEFLEFDLFDSTTTVRIGPHLALREKCRCSRDLNRWIWDTREGPRHYLATALVVFPGAADVCRKAHSLIAAPSGSLVSMTPLAGNFAVFRMMTNSVPATSAWVQSIAGQLAGRFPLLNLINRIW